VGDSLPNERVGRIPTRQERHNAPFDRMHQRLVTPEVQSWRLELLTMTRETVLTKDPVRGVGEFRGAVLTRVGGEYGAIGQPLLQDGFFFIGGLWRFFGGHVGIDTDAPPEQTIAIKAFAR